MRLSISSKIVAMTITGILFSSVVVLAMVALLMRGTSGAQLDTEVRRLRNVVAEYQRTYESNFTDSAKRVAEDPRLTTAMAENDSAAVIRLAAMFMRQNKADLCTITDASGIVTARGHSDRRGDSLADQLMVRKALQGESVFGIVQSAVVPFSIRASIPVMKDGKILGTVALGSSITTESFLDSIKRLSGLEASFFNGDVRVMTTITENGKRIIGTKLNNRDIEEAVLKRGEILFRDASISGKPYKTAYWPVKNIEGAIVGMWFVGNPIQDYLDENQRTLFISIAGMLGIAAVLACCAAVFGRRLTRPIRDVTTFASAVSGGNLETRLDVKTTDEVGVLADALRTMVAALKARITESEQKSREAEEQSKKALEAMREAAAARERTEEGQKELLRAAENVETVVTGLSAATEELSAQVDESNKGAEQARGQVASAAAAMEEMNATVLEVAKNAGTAAQSSDRAQKKAREGEDIVRKSVESILSVQKGTRALRQSMEALGRQAESIGTVMTVISDIADQTNLLALNAAIEAARAGDAGRGFAVVADEVRKLAEKTMGATKEVSEAIKGIQTGTRHSIATVEETGGSLDATAELVSRSGGALTEIVTEVALAASQVGSIAAAAEEQSQTSEEIARSLEGIHSMAENSANAMRESAEAVVELARQTQDLQKLVNALRKNG